MVGRGLALALLVAACGGGANVPVTEADCGDGIDEDDDGLTDCDDSDCEGAPECVPPAEVCTGGVDEDGDLYADCDDDDCWGDPACYQVDDPTDLDAALGDPSLDIDKSRVTLVNGTATFFLTFDGTWPPADSFYSWFVLVEIANDGFTTVARTTVQRHDGVNQTIPLGIPLANITVRQVPRGIWVRMVGVPTTGETYYVESGIQKANPGTRVTDTVVSSPQPLP